jgi:hypothetical protein
MLAKSLDFLQKNRMTDIITREITGNNIPHILITRNHDELIDQSISQFGNTAAYFGTGFLMSKVLDTIPKLFKKELTPITQPWFHLGKSFSIFSLITAINLAMPFLRNYITTRRTHTTNYADMVGAKGKAAETPNQEEAALKKDKNRFLTIMGIGASISASLMALTMLLMKRQKALPKLLKQVHNWIGLKDGKFQNFNSYSAVLFWVIPTFTGLMMAARDQYEQKELALRFVAFNLAFFVFPHTIEKGIDHLVKNMKPTKLFGPSRNISYLGKFISSLIFCSSLPTVLNIYLTRQRVLRENAKAQPGAVNPFKPVTATMGTFQYAQP